MAGRILHRQTAASSCLETGFGSGTALSSQQGIKTESAERVPEIRCDNHKLGLHQKLHLPTAILPHDWWIGCGGTDNAGIISLW